jgi:hypothetical protein
LKILFKSSSLNLAKDLPVFSFPNGKTLTSKQFTETRRALLIKHVGKEAMQISGHSFSKQQSLRHWQIIQAWQQIMKS